MAKDERITIDLKSSVPVYKQIIGRITALIQEEAYRAGDLIPSMNELTDQLQISKETIKKSYDILRKRGLIKAIQGKGFFVAEQNEGRKLRILLLFDKLSTYKKVLYDSFYEQLGSCSEITIRLHNQDIDAFENFLDENLGLFDYYVITPHFPVDEQTHRRVLRAVRRIPYRNLILLDKNLEDLPGGYGAVYQDFRQDVYSGLMQASALIRNYAKLHVFTSASSLYGAWIKEGVLRFCRDQYVPFAFHPELSPDIICQGDAYLVLNGQLDAELIRLIRVAKERGLEIGKDIGILSYNEAPINEIILNGLSTLSTDFRQMGALAAEMILQQKPRKVKCDFLFVARHTF